MGAAWFKSLGEGTVNLPESRIVEILHQSPIMIMMDSKMIDQIAGCFTAVRFASGATIPQEQNQFYIVAEGSVDVSSMIMVNNKEKLSELLCKRKPGDFVSFAAREQLLSRIQEAKGSPRASITFQSRKNLYQMLDLSKTTADVVEGCVLLRLNREKFIQLRAKTQVKRPDKRNTERYTKDSNSHRKMTETEQIHVLNSIIDTEVVNYLLEIPFLEDVSDSRLLSLVNICSYAYVKCGEVLCREGEVGDRFYICIRGSLEASTQQMRTMLEKGHRGKMVEHHITTCLPLKRLGSGAYFGEISLMFKIPRIASVTAIENSLVVYIDSQAFCNFMKVVPDSATVLKEHIRLQFLDMLSKQGVPFLNAIPSLKIQELSSMSRMDDLKESSVIMEKGDKDSGFYLLLHGRIDVVYFNHNTKDKEVVVVNPGGYFGYESIMLEMPSLIRATCRENCIVLALTRQQFEEFFIALPEVYSEFCIRSLRKRVHVEHVIQHYECHKLWAAGCLGRRCHREVALFEHIEDFKWEADISDARIHERALMIYMNFFVGSRVNRVELSEQVIEGIEKALSEQNVDRHIFEKARQEILNRMDDKNFEAFKHSSLFEEFLDQLVCPQTIYDMLTPEMETKLQMRRKVQDVIYVDEVVETSQRSCRKSSFSGSLRSVNMDDTKLQGSIGLQTRRKMDRQRTITRSRRVSSSFVF